jgi:hypothetical protein
MSLCAVNTLTCARLQTVIARSAARTIAEACLRRAILFIDFECEEKISLNARTGEK